MREKEENYAVEFRSFTKIRKSAAYHQNFQLS